MLLFIGRHGKVKGARNLTVEGFQKELNQNILPPVAKSYGLQLPISKETARKYMRRVGCTYRRHMKGIYFDHHERDDVQAYRAKFLKQINEYLTMTYNYFSLPARQAALLYFGGTIEIADLEEARLFRKSAGRDSPEVHGAIAITDVLERVRCTGEGTADGSQFDSMVLQWEVDHFDREFYTRHGFKQLFPEVVAQDHSRRRMHGMLNAKIDWDDPENLPVIICDQDECIVKAGDMQREYWQTPGHKPTQAKTEGSGFMLSAYRAWFYGGFIELTDAQKTAAKRVNKPRDTWNEEDRKQAELRHWTEETAGNWRSYHCFDYGKNREGYWNGAKMSVQAAEVLDALAYLTPGHQIVSLYDWSSCHDKLSSTAVRASNFKLCPGFQFYAKAVAATTDKGTVTDPGHEKGAQKPFECATYLELDTADFDRREADWIEDGKIFFKFQQGDKDKLVIGTKSTVGELGLIGQPKGIRQLLKELGMFNGELKRTASADSGDDSLDRIFNSLSFIEEQKSVLEEVTEEKGGKCLMLPKFHCEFNPIERVWGRTKMYIRAFNTGALPNLRKIILTALSHENIPEDLHVKYERKSRDYMRAYLTAECDPAQAEMKVRQMRKYRSHRGIPPSEFTEKKQKPWGAKKAKGFVSKSMKVAAALAMKQGNGLADVTEDNDDDDEVDQ